jgi:Holliday junction DNA helicase RuvA
VTLIVHTHAREDALTLFGFASEVERAVFRVLMAIPKVGAKTALLILSMLPPAELATAVANRDLKRLTAISGVGKAMAERLLFELPKSLPKVGDLGGASTPLRASDDGTRLLGALTNMGFRAAEAEKAVSGLSDRIGKEPLPELLKAALASLR